MEWPPSLALGSGDGTVHFYDTATWSVRATKRVHEGRTWWVGYDPRGARLGTASFAGSIAILNPNDGRVLRQWKGHEARIYDASWHPEGAELVTVDFSGWVRTWDPKSGKEKRAWRVLDGEQLARGAHSSDGTQLLVTSRQGLRVYTTEGELTVRLDVGTTTVAAWTKDDELVVSSPGEVHILPLDAASWRGDPGRLVADAEKAAATKLSEMLGMATQQR